MGTIQMGTSPLRAAREWRGLGVVAAAREAGLPVAQIEALEAGDASAFGSTEELVGAAVVYGATLDIGRDEAVALLDRSIDGDDVRIEVGVPGPLADEAPKDAGTSGVQGFSAAVQERSAKIVGGGAAATSSVALRGIGDAGAAPADTEGATGTDTGTDTDTDTEADPVRAGGSDGGRPGPGGLVLDPDLRPGSFGVDPDADEMSFDFDEALDEGGQHDWAARADEDGNADPTQRLAGASVAARVRDAAYVASERIVGTERTDRAADRLADAGAAARERTIELRDRLRESEHGTLIAAVVGGALVVALLVAVASVMGSGDEPTAAERVDGAAGDAATSADGEAAGAGAATGTATPKAAGGGEGAAATQRAAMVPASSITVDVFNIGATKGKAASVAEELESLGYKVGEVGNSKGEYGGAMIIHPKGLDREALVLSRHVDITTMDVAPGSSKRFTIIVR